MATVGGEMITASQSERDDLTVNPSVMESQGHRKLLQNRYEYAQPDRCSREMEIKLAICVERNLLL